MAMITATAWVPRGVAAEEPKRYDVDDEELERIQELAKLKLNDAKSDLDAARKGENESDWTDEDEAEQNGANSSSKKKSKPKASIDPELAEYDLENYSSDSDDEEKTLDMFGNPKALAFYENNEQDPYITLKGDDESDSEKEDVRIRTTDNLVIAARVEDEIAQLEVYVYEDTEANLYVHHDLMLPSIPLCVEWLDIAVGKSRSGGLIDQTVRSNYVAVGTFEPDIEIWDLDTMDSMYPNAILGAGGEDDHPAETNGDSGKKKKKKRRSKKTNSSYHIDAVLALAASRSHRTLLASASADTTVKLWDLSTARCAHSYDFHTDKACALDWNPNAPTVLLTGSHDRTAVVAEMRSPGDKVPRWGVEADIEAVRWDLHREHLFYVASEAGTVHLFDQRMAPAEPSASKPVWTLQAHDEGVSAFDLSAHVPGMMVTGSTDEMVKVWSIESTGPKLVVSRKLGVGKVFSSTFAPDEGVGFRVAVAGSEGKLQVWDTTTNASIRKAFASRMKESGGDKQEDKLVGVEDNSDSESEDDEDGGVAHGEGAEDDMGAEEKGWESMDED